MGGVSWWIRRQLYKLWYRWIYLRSPHWRKFRARMIEKVGRSCEVEGCGFQNTNFLDCHHLTYLRLGKERPVDVLVLCRKHHNLVHRGFVYKFKKRR